MKHLNEVLRKYLKEELPIMENAVGDLLIKPGYRKDMKKEIQKAWILDLQEELDPELANIVLTKEGIMIVCENEIEGCYTIENNIKIKNMSYDPYECPINIDEI